MDLFSRKIVSWELAPSLETKYVISAVQKAISRTGTRPTVIHTDRGVQYTSAAYFDETTGILKSYSEKANPWDNACIESFHALIKREWLNRFMIQDIKQAHRLVFEYIDTFYNTKRIHSTFRLVFMKICIISSIRLSVKLHNRSQDFIKNTVC